MANNRLETVKWAGYQFKFEKIIFEEDNMEVEAQGERILSLRRLHSQLDLK